MERLSAAAWAAEQFGGARLGDARRTRRLIESARRVALRIGGSLPRLMADPAALQGLYRLMNRPETTHAAVLAPHLANVRTAMAAASGPVLILKDHTVLDFTTHRSLTGLGVVGNGGGRGYLCHNALAIDADSGRVLGLCDQRLHVNPAPNKRAESRPAKRARDSRQSRLWVDSAEAPGPAPAGARWIEVCDSEADTFEFLEALRRLGRGFVIRSRWDRRTGPRDDAPRDVSAAKLQTFARTLPEWGRYELAVPARARSNRKPARPARTATLAIACGVSPVQPPPKAQRRGEHGDEPLDLTVVRVWEPDEPAAEGAEREDAAESGEPLEWILLTDQRPGALAEARRVAGWHARRWTIEDYHKGMKTGCGVEGPQFTAVERLEPAIALLSVAAVRLLQLRAAARDPALKNRPAREVVPDLWVRVLALWRRPAGDGGDWSVEDFLLVLARPGGHQNRPRDGPPGWITLWRGWADLQARVETAEALLDTLPQDATKPKAFRQCGCGGDVR